MNINEFDVIRCSPYRASSKSVTCHDLIGLNDEGNTREVCQGQQTNKFCLFDTFMLTNEYLSLNQLPTCLYTLNVTPRNPLNRSVDK